MGGCYQADVSSCIWISQSRKEETPYVTGDMLKGPFKYFGGVVEPWWVTSLGVGVHVPEGVPLFYRLFHTLSNLYRARLKMIPRLRECCRQSQAEVLSKSSNKIHQTWGPSFSRAL